MFNPGAKRRQEKFVKFFTISAGLMNRIRWRVESTSVLQSGRLRYYDSQVARSLVPHFINTTTFAATGFWPRRGASDAHTLQGSVRSEQRSLGLKEPPPEGLRRFSVLASLLLGHSPTSRDAPSSRLARTENRRNKRGRIYEMGYLEEY